MSAVPAPAVRGDDHRLANRRILKDAEIFRNRRSGYRRCHGTLLWNTRISRKSRKSKAKEMGLANIRILTVKCRPTLALSAGWSQKHIAISVSFCGGRQATSAQSNSRIESTNDPTSFSFARSDFRTST
jgi:hypothetical protein